MLWEQWTDNSRFLPADGTAEESAGEMAVKLIRSMAEARPADIIPVDPGDVLKLLRRPGTMRFFHGDAAWEDGNERSAAVDRLCAELEQTAAAGQAEYGSSLRILLQIETSEDIGLEEVERCVRALDPAGSGVLVVHVRVGCDNAVRVRGLMGAWDGAR